VSEGEGNVLEDSHPKVTSVQTQGFKDAVQLFPARLHFDPCLGMTRCISETRCPPEKKRHQQGSAPEMWKMDGAAALRAHTG
ncbi:hypothetical protein KUCAC02_000929, partial [Chaenocephalus aceratus]